MGNVTAATASAGPVGTALGEPRATGPGTLSNVEGTGSVSHRLLGHTMTNARPMMFSIGTGPWHRESCDTMRLSPMTNP